MHTLPATDTDRSAAFLKSASEGILLAGDTEYQGTHTLTVQFAVRIDDVLYVQVYRSPALLDVPDESLKLGSLKDSLRGLCKRIVYRSLKLLDDSLSPMRVLADLFGLKGVQAVPTQTGDSTATSPEDGPPSINLTLVSHCMRADILRLFGSSYYDQLLGSTDARPARVVLAGQKRYCFRPVGSLQRVFVVPVVEYARVGGNLHPVRLNTLDTNLPFGSHSLDELAKAFLGVRKAEPIPPLDKARMLEEFLNRPEAAYRYAVFDALLTLLLAEQMRKMDREMYQELGFAESLIPSMKNTLGSRVAEMIVRTAARHAAGSVQLARNNRPGAVGLTKIRTLMAQGSGQEILKGRLSRFLTQSSDTHGGLCFSRTSTRFFHEAPGQFRDVDLSGCYPAILRRMHIYAGRPWIWEPGAEPTTLKEVIPQLMKHAAGHDAWIVKVSGPIMSVDNVLIPSTDEALTNKNYRNRTSRARAKARQQGVRRDSLFDEIKGTGPAHLYTRMVEGGVVAYATWLMIQAMPEAARKEYENLEVDTVIFYHKELVADDGPSYDALVDRYKTDAPLWATTLDFGKLEMTTKERPGEEHVALRIPIGDLVGQFMAHRESAKQQDGSGSVREIAWKEQANTIYGVIASPHKPTNNVVAANIVTATARAAAFPMQMGLNGFQLITDGCIYRRDQIPAVTFAECLRLFPDYARRRPEEEVPYLDPAQVPTDDAEFTAWYRTHFKRFFGVSGPEYDELLGLHAIAHKGCGNGDKMFDGLCCDGVSNYAKLLFREGQWKMVALIARSFGKAAKAKLQPWLLKTYLTDQYIGPPPVVASTRLLTLNAASRVARQSLEALTQGLETDEEPPVEVYFPLGLENKQVLTYKVIKPSAFLFQTPEQRAVVVRGWMKFVKKYGAGLEVLALRRSYRNRTRGSLVCLAEEVYEYLSSGGKSLSNKLTLHRGHVELAEVQKALVDEVEQAKENEKGRLAELIDIRQQGEDERLTGWYARLVDITRRPTS